MAKRIPFATTRCRSGPLRRRRRHRQGRPLPTAILGHKPHTNYTRPHGIGCNRGQGLYGDVYRCRRPPEPEGLHKSHRLRPNPDIVYDPLQILIRRRRRRGLDKPTARRCSRRLLPNSKRQQAQHVGRIVHVLLIYERTQHHTAPKTEA